MPYYESVYIARQEITAQQVDALTDSFEEIIKEGGGNVTKRENWGLKSLAYRIKKSRKAHYTLLNIDAPAEAVHEVERLMRLNEDVLRYLTLRVDKLDEEPSFQAQIKPNRPYTSGNEGEFRARQNEPQEETIEKVEDEIPMPEITSDSEITPDELQVKDKGE